MEPQAFSDSRVKEIYDSYNFMLCDSKFATNELLETDTVEEQENTEEACRKAKAHFERVQGKDGPLLVRDIHIQFLLKQLHGLSHDYVALEGSRSWIVFWCVNGLRILNHPIEHSLAHKIMTFLASCQKPTGGFGGSPSHIAHIATTYASVMSLASLGTEEALAIINRKTLYEFILSLKQPN
uniref:Protein farnesyltransferase n=1 Tax=Panagrolaimus sp. PS1159 TaxID=55785 RepID=A0AC35G1I9_9BILA